MKINLIIFRVSGKHYAFQLEKIPLILKLDKVRSSIPDLNEIPESISYLFEEIKIINLTKVLGLEETPLSENAKLILGDFGQISAGCFVDKVVSLMKIDSADIIETEELKKEKYTIGFLRDKPDVKYLDVDKIFEEHLKTVSIRN